jgi:predicted aspartyl protease
MLRPANHVGLIHVHVSVSVSGATLPGYQGSFLVDTGATDSMAAASDLSRAGIQPVGRKTYEMADGSVHEYRFGLAQIEVMGEVTAGRVILVPKESSPFLA